MLLTGLTPIAAKTALEEKRRIGRVQATYLTHLINLTQWDKAHLPKPSQSAKVVILGDKENGFTESLEFLLEESGITIEGNKIDILHFANDDKANAIEALSNKPQIVFRFLQRKGVHLCFNRVQLLQTRRREHRDPMCGFLGLGLRVGGRS